MGEEYLKIEDINKRYGVVCALKNVSFTVRRGEIHALLGENGAGKSTLVKIIMGEETPDSGFITLDGTLMEFFHPHYSRTLGIQMVHQELAIFENLTVAENMFPWNSENKRSPKIIDWKTLYGKTQKALNLFDFKTISPSQRMDTVSLAGQQMIEILRCIIAQPKILLLDEPTSGLNSEEGSRLMKVLKSLREKGLTVIYISHRINEIIEIADRVTVLRDGQFVVTLEKEKLDEKTLINSMVNKELSGTLYNGKRQNAHVYNKDTLLDVRHLYRKNILSDSSFKLYKSEVLGFFGLEGSGTEKLSRMLYGLEQSDLSEIYFDGKKIEKLTSGEMIKRGILYLNGNRKYAGILHNMAVTDNISMPQLEKLSNKFTFIQKRRLTNITKEFVKKFSIVLPDVNVLPRNLSGGNQQKVMLAICLATNPRLLIVNEPTRGIDVGAKAQIHKQLEQIAEDGVGIIVFSSELPELFSLCDRVIVMHESKINGEVWGEDLAEERVMQMASLEQSEKTTIKFNRLDAV
jgi:ribose transport system ATP-binding protein